MVADETAVVGLLCAISLSLQRTRQHRKSDTWFLLAPDFYGIHGLIDFSPKSVLNRACAMAL